MERPKVGETVHIIGCKFNENKHYIEEYRLLEVHPDHIILEHIATLTKAGREECPPRHIRESVDLLEYFATPMEERLKKHFEQVKVVCDAFLKPNDH